MSAVRPAWRFRMMGGEREAGTAAPAARARGREAVDAGKSFPEAFRGGKLTRWSRARGPTSRRSGKDRLVDACHRTFRRLTSAVGVAAEAPEVGRLGKVTSGSFRRPPEIE